MYELVLIWAYAATIYLAALNVLVSLDPYVRRMIHKNGLANLVITSCVPGLNLLLATAASFCAVVCLMGVRMDHPPSR